MSHLYEQLHRHPHMLCYCIVRQDAEGLVHDVELSPRNTLFRLCSKHDTFACGPGFHIQAHPAYRLKRNLRHLLLYTLLRTLTVSTFATFRRRQRQTRRWRRRPSPLWRRTPQRMVSSAHTVVHPRRRWRCGTPRHSTQTCSRRRISGWVSAHQLVPSCSLGV
jgi:hypothetical protein